MKSIAHISVIQKNKTHAPIADTAAVVEIAAVADEFHVIDSIHASFDVAPGSTESVQIAIGGVETFLDGIPNAAGVFEFLFPRGHYKQVVNQAVVVTLSPSAGGAKGTMNVSYR